MGPCPAAAAEHLASRQRDGNFDANSWTAGAGDGHAAARRTPCSGGTPTFAANRAATTADGRAATTADRDTYATTTTDGDGAACGTPTAGRGAPTS